MAGRYAVDAYDRQGRPYSSENTFRSQNGKHIGSGTVVSLPFA
jgi:hypothetical protein